MIMKKHFWGNLLIALVILLIILPLLTIVLWVFTERWAWPALIPQTFSLRAVAAIFRDGKELAQLFASSVFISLAVALLSVIIGTMTARALVCYEFIGKKFFSFLFVIN